MRRLGLVILVALVAGVLVLVWEATTVVLSDEAPDVAAAPVVGDVSPASAPPKHALSRAEVPARGEHAAKPASSLPLRPASAVPAEPSGPHAGEREDAVETIAARVHGVALAQFARSERGEAPSDARRPVPGARLRFVCGARTVFETESGRDGRFEAQFEAQGPCRLVLEAPEGWKPMQAERALARDELTGSMVVELRFLRGELDPNAIGGDVHGVLLSESGAWSVESLPRRGAVLLDLVSARDPNVSLRAEVVHGEDANGAATLEFVFKDVPKGEYELTLSALDSFRWHPGSLRVSPPADGLSFLRYDKEKALPVSFRVIDAGTRAPIESFQARRLAVSTSAESGVFLHTGPIELGTFPLQGSFQWSVWAEGYAPAFGDETGFVQEGDRRVAEVALVRGWGTKVLALARDPVARPLGGAEVVVDGRVVGRTGADGMLVVRAEAAPKKMDVRANGLALAGNPLAPYQGKSAEQRGQVTIAFLAPVK